MALSIESVAGFMVVNGVSVAPVGSAITMYGGTLPAGYLPLGDVEYSQTAYPELYAIIGDTYAITGGRATPAVGNFRLPPSEVDGLGLYERGVGATNGAVGTYQEDVFKSHSHLITVTTSGDANKVNVGASTSAGTASTQATGDATETRPRSLTVLKGICAGREVI